MNAASDEDRRNQSNRRTKPTSLWGAFRWGGQRSGSRRADERQQHHFVDRFPASTLAFVVLLLAFSMVDAVNTVHLLDEGCHEINPVMRHLLNTGLLPFLVGKYLLTAAGLPLLLICQNYSLFGTRFRVRYVIPLLVSAYVVLLGYQFCLLHPRAGTPVGSAAAVANGG